MKLARVKYRPIVLPMNAFFVNILWEWKNETLKYHVFILNEVLYAYLYFLFLIIWLYESMAIKHDFEDVKQIVTLAHLMLFPGFRAKNHELEHTKIVHDFLLRIISAWAWFHKAMSWHHLHFMIKIVYLTHLQGQGLGYTSLQVLEHKTLS